MSEGKIEYQFRCEGLELKPIKINLGLNAFPQLIINAIDTNIFRAIITTKQIYSENDARKTTDQLINKIVEKLSFFLEKGATKPIFISSSLPSESHDGGSCKRSISFPIFDGTCRVVSKPNDETLKQMISFLENQQIGNELLIADFAHALNQRDPIANFMLLYNLILQVSCDSQKKVDETIRKLDPNVIVIKVKRENNIGREIEYEETIYTKLRNEIAHSRKGVMKENTIKDIRNNVSKFVGIVKKAIF